MKKKPLKVYGLPEAALEKLRLISVEKYGDANISHLARDLLLKEVENPVVHTDRPEYTNNPDKTRMELKLPTRIAAWLKLMAEKQYMSSNRVALAILMEYIDKHPVILDHDADLLRVSNYQLVMIGRNLNQIARHLNAGENVSLSSQQITDLKKFIEAHVGKVNHVLQTNRRRKRE
ncbi:plasmid mobilization relaxosome protein MobC [Neisseria wadsworthii]|uniref:plasmid mobilization relaxosome protein MobC n=1 Tax=Neisseria wadsworthii TaxID=607711 RepID=UPI000D313304|nr:plasmid mobilization relaxosome protein MobC [Neisseria wadsworthii]